MKILLTLILLLIYSHSFATSNVHANLFKKQEILEYLDELNSMFNLQVKLREVPRCGFALRDVIDGVYLIDHCKADLEVFENPNDLLLIISHEYAHILFGHHKSAAGAMIEYDFIYGRLDEALFLKLKDNQKLSQMLFEKFLNPFEVDLSFEKKLKKASVRFLFELDHSHIDSLGVKLMFLTKRVPNPEAIKVYIQSLGLDDLYSLNMIRERTKNIYISVGDQLSAWSDLKCIFPGRNVPDSILPIKNHLLYLGHHNLLDAINQECTTENTIEIFEEGIKNYFKDMI